MLVPNGHCYRCSFHLEPRRAACGCAGFVGESIEQNMPGQVAAVVGEVVTNANGATVYQPGYLTALQKEAHALPGRCSSSTRSPPASAAPARGSPWTTRASSPT